MAKFYGVVGFADGDSTEIAPGVYSDSIYEKKYTGDVIRNARRRQDADQVNPNFTISNEFSLIMDSYSMKNFHKIRYVEWMGTKWNVNNVDVNYPRMTLQVGGVYNGPEKN